MNLIFTIEPPPLPLSLSQITTFNRHALKKKVKLNKLDELF